MSQRKKAVHHLKFVTEAIDLSRMFMLAGDFNPSWGQPTCVHVPLRQVTSWGPWKVVQPGGKTTMETENGKIQQSLSVRFFIIYCYCITIKMLFNDKQESGVSA